MQGLFLLSTHVAQLDSTGAPQAPAPACPGKATSQGLASMACPGLTRPLLGWLGEGVRLVCVALTPPHAAAPAQAAGRAREGPTPSVV